MYKFVLKGLLYDPNRRQDCPQKTLPMWLLKMVIHGSKCIWFSRDRLNFNPCMGWLVVQKSTNQLLYNHLAGIQRFSKSDSTIHFECVDGEIGSPPPRLSGWWNGKKYYCMGCLRVLIHLTAFNNSNP